MAIMTVNEFRKSTKYDGYVEKIKKCNKDFTFEVNFSSISVEKANALKVLLYDCYKMGLLEIVSIGLSISGEIVKISFKRI